MEITEIKVFPVSEEKLKAFVSVVIDDCFMVNDIKVIRGKDGLFISMPSRRKKNGKFKDVAHPLNNETRQMLERLILAEYEVALKAQDQGAEATPAPRRQPPRAAAPSESAPAAKEAEGDTAAEAGREESAQEEQPAEPRPKSPAAQEKTLEEVAELHLRDSFWNS